MNRVQIMDLATAGAAGGAAMRAESGGETRLKAGASRRRRAQGCGACPGCLRDDCGQCRNCRDKVKFGGPGTKKQRCMLRGCSSMVSAGWAAM